MNILIVTQYFMPESFRINDLAVALKNRGYNITVLTGAPNYPSGSFFNGYGFFNRRENMDGIDVIRVPLIPRGSGSGIRLAINYLSFALFATIMGPFLCSGKYDLIFVFEPSPITVGIPAILLKKLKNVPIMFWVQDLWPESLSATGAIKSLFILSLVDKLVAWIYKNCDVILAQSRGFVGSISKFTGTTGKVHYFPNSAENIFDQGVFSIQPVESFPSGFKVMFAGNIGTAQDFETILAAAEQLRDYPEIKWLIVGDGRTRVWVETQVELRGLQEQFHFFGRQPLDLMPSYFICADVLLVTLKKEPIFALTIPTKIQSYLTCGKPIIAALDGEGAKIVSESGAGLECPAESPPLLAQAVLRIFESSSEEQRQMGIKGRAYYDKHFKSSVLLEKLELLISETVSKFKGTVSL